MSVRCLSAKGWADSVMALSRTAPCAVRAAVIMQSDDSDRRSDQMALVGTGCGCGEMAVTDAVMRWKWQAQQ